jgi:quinol monooxygenase YgiN
MPFIQIIDFETGNFDEMQAAVEEFRKATEGKRGTTRARTGKDRDRENHYVTIVEFESYEEAMRNSEMPETNALAEKMQKLSSGPPTFLNLDVVYAEDD